MCRFAVWLAVDEYFVLMTIYFRMSCLVVQLLIATAEIGVLN
jgi:hypothetical protein